MSDIEAKAASAYFGGGCFWCLEAVFADRPGVLDVTAGYAGGTSEHPDYEEVCAGGSGHAEMVRIDYDPEKTNYQALLDLFFTAHDPTTPDRQGADVGTQYRSIVLYGNEAERESALAARDQASRAYDRPAVTEIGPFTVFHEAEDYHQDFYRKNPAHGYCAYVIRPKMKKLGLE